MINEDSNKEKEFYNKIGKIIGWDFSQIKYDVIDNSKFQYFDEINNNISENTLLLDIGTGGGEKLSNLISNNCLMKIGTDFSEEMIKIAKKNNKNKKIRFFEMDSDKLNFPNDFFDIITARHTPFNSKEVTRLLKQDGLFFSEQVDEDDCKELKELFGRGQGYNEKNKLIDKIKTDIKGNELKQIEFYDITQEEYYKTEEDLLFLLNNTPIIPDFGKVKDDYAKFNYYVEKNTTDKGIRLNRRLFGIKLTK